MENSVWGVRLSPDEHEYLDGLASQTEGILTKAGVMRVLIRQAKATDWNPLTSASGFQTMGEPAPRRGSSTSKEDSSIEVSFCLEPEKPKAKSNPFKHAELHPELECARETFVRFGKAKKGDRGEHGAKLAATGLRKIGEKYGWDVARDQLDLAINNRWNGISLSNYEKFLPKAAANEPQHRHPASKVFTAKDFGIGPASNPVIGDLF